MFTGAKEIGSAGIKAVARYASRIRGLLAGGCCLLIGAGFSPWRPGVVVGHSMEPTLPHGSPFLYDQTYYRQHPLRAGDVVVIRHGKEVWIKRVYATGGTRFWTLRSGDQEQVRHDPIRPAEQVRFARVAQRLRSIHGVDYRVVRLQLPADSVFLLGDNPTSEDSRVLGPVAASEIMGRVVTLPGQRLGAVPGWVELSLPHVRRAATPAGDLDRQARGRRKSRASSGNEVRRAV